MVDSVESDVLVVGAGCAGLRAAIEADREGASVVVVSKAPAGANSATVLSGGGFRAALEGLTVREHLEDTLAAGRGINDRRLVQVLVQEAAKRVLELGEFGVGVRARRGGASVGDIPSLRGLGITMPMVNHLRSRGVRMAENIVVTRLLEDGGVVGAVGYDVRNDRPVTFSTKAVILAAGGAGAIYGRTTCPLRTTGDGYSLAYRAGAQLRDMEFVQFYPLALAEPGAPPFLIRIQRARAISSEGRIVNRLGEDIPEKYGIARDGMLARSRDLISRAVMMEILNGNGVDGAVLLDASEVFDRHGEEEWFSSGLHAFFHGEPSVRRVFRVAPVSHFCMGGVVIDEHGRTGVHGLYAAGEVAGGVHGANAAPNQLTEAVVFGARAGAAAAEFAKARRSPSVGGLAEEELERYEGLRVRRDAGGVSPSSLLSRLREVMWLKAGVVRDEAGLKDALAEVKALRASAEGLGASTAREMLEALEAPMALDAAEMVISAALLRRESRGAHYRADHPLEDGGWMKVVVIERSEGEGMNLYTMPL